MYAYSSAVFSIVRNYSDLIALEKTNIGNARLQFRVNSQLVVSHLVSSVYRDLFIVFRISCFAVHLRENKGNLFLLRVLCFFNRDVRMFYKLTEHCSHLEI